MIKDYAKRAEYTTKPRHKRILLTILVISAAIVIPAMMYYIKYQKTQHHKPIPITQTKQKTNNTQKVKHNNNDFEFYTLLPQNQ